MRILNQILAANQSSLVLIKRVKFYWFQLRIIERFSKEYLLEKITSIFKMPKREQQSTLSARLELLM